MKMMIGLLTVLEFSRAYADSAFQPYVGKYEVIAVSTDCTSRCIQENDVVTIDSTQKEATFSVRSYYAGRYQIVMRKIH